MKTINIKNHDAETKLRVGVWAVCRRVCLVAGLSVAVVVGALGADFSAAAGAFGSSEESSLGETPTHKTQTLGATETQTQYTVVGPSVTIVRMSEEAAARRRGTGGNPRKGRNGFTPNP
jgi:hypothetical protein